MAGELHRLLAASGGFGIAGDPVEVAGPLKLGCRVTVQGFIEEAEADVLAYRCFPGSGGGQAEGLFLETCCVPPPVLPLQDLGQYEKDLEALRGIFEQIEAFFQRLIFLAK